MKRNLKDKMPKKFKLSKILPIVVSCLILTFAGIYLGVNTGLADTVQMLAEEIKTPVNMAFEDTDNQNQPIDFLNENKRETPEFDNPSEMRGVWFVPGLDYMKTNENTGESVKAEIDDLFKKVYEWEFNTIILPLWKDDSPLFENSVGLENVNLANSDGSAFNPIEYIIKKAKDNGVFTYGVLDFKMRDTTVENTANYDMSITEDKETALTLVEDVVSKYEFNGFLIDNFGYNKGESTDYTSYMSTNPGVGFEDYMENSMTDTVSKISKIVQNVDNNFYLGVIADSVWAHLSDNLQGSDTAKLYSSYTDGFSNTIQWVYDNLVDFVMLDNQQSTKNSSTSFDTVLSWWDSVCDQAKTPLYVTHSATSVVEKPEGWSSPDELTKQLIACQGTDTWSGSVYNSFSAFLKDEGGSTKAVLKQYSGSLDKKLLYKDLIVSNPNKSEITTEEPVFNIRGNADTNFPILMNDKEIELSEAGDFSIDVDLKVGKNIFKFEHKGEKATITINYRFVVLKSMKPTENVTTDGSTMFGVSAVARKGARVSARLGGSSATLKQATSNNDNERFSEDSEFQFYYGEFKLPEGSTSGAKRVGAVSVSASVDGVTDNKTGGVVTLKKHTPIVVNPGEITPPPPPTGNEDTGFLPAGGNIVENAPIVQITDSYAETFDGNTGDDFSRTTNAYLPKGTKDAVRKNVGNYYLLNSGRRVYKRTTKTIENKGTIKANQLQARYSGVSGSRTYFRVGTSWQVPYNVRLKPQSYPNLTSSNNNYTINSFTATYIDFTFSYTTSVSGSFNLSSNPLFKSAEWIKEGNHEYTLRLHLKKAGGFYGYSAKWDSSNGNLEIAFVNPHSNSLSGKRIVLDPGHGGKDPGTSGGKVLEKTMTLQYANALKSELERRGAIVTLTRTGDTLPGNSNYSIYRKNFARNNGTDLFVSLHMDSAGSSARGYTIFYFNEFSMPFAKAVNSRISPIYNRHAGFNNQRGYKNNIFGVMRLNDCPSILIECGFMSNVKDLALIQSSSYRNDLMKGVADGMADYFANS